MEGDDDSKHTNLKHENNSPKEEQEEKMGNNIINNNNNDQTIVELLDSVDSYLTLFDSLSSILRQGWLELASARHSMGVTRISSSLFDLNCHTATTSLKVNLGDASTEMKQTDFALCKWGSNSKQGSHEDAKSNDDELRGKSSNLLLRRRGTSEIQEKDQESNAHTLPVEEQIQRERSKSLSMFGTLVSPKLRASQLSFEFALDIIVEIANMRSIMVSTYNDLQKEKESNQK